MKKENKFKIFVEKNKIASIIVALFLFIGIATPITYAYLQDSTAEVTNTFTPGKVSTEIIEDFDGFEKKDVVIKNTGNIPAYIRAAIVVNWAEKDAEGIYAAEAPKATDYEMAIDPNWFVGHDGYYYHKAPVKPGESTSVLINSAKPISKKEGYTLSIEILGSGIQSMPDEAVVDAWGQDVFESLGGGES